MGDNGRVNPDREWVIGPGPVGARRSPEVGAWEQLWEPGIEPHVTLHHVDLPQVLEDEYEGWISRKIVYVSLPLTSKWRNYIRSSPQDSLSFPEYWKDFIGYADVCFHWGVMTRDFYHLHDVRAHLAILNAPIEDEIATQRANDFYIGWFWNPLIFGDYPDVMKKNAGSRIPAFTVQESDSIRGQKMRRNSTLEDWPRVYYLQAHIGTLLDTIRELLGRVNADDVIRRIRSDGLQTCPLTEK
ncbi:hypothetical protein TIFTF001_016262 [Ficus carica]|uniref:Uncharacterized protein n=1 Tax=Ficus carica TaxID=3494 RepID=A0AA88D8L8_FICCA|nr:hypothetical protein TIFTF001_016262 [Ficus carica]